MRSFRDKLFSAIQQRAQLFGLEGVFDDVFDGREDDHENFIGRIYIQRPSSFETIVGIYLWASGAYNNSQAVNIDFISPKRLPIWSHTSSVSQRSIKSFMRILPNSQKDISKMLAYLDKLLMKKIKVFEALGAAAPDDSEGEEDSSKEVD